jgi:hypothetical protein
VLPPPALVPHVLDGFPSIEYPNFLKSLDTYPPFHGKKHVADLDPKIGVVLNLLFRRMPEQIRRFTKEHQNDVITFIQVLKDPINPIIAKTLNAMTLGNALKQGGTLYHLSLHVQTNKGIFTIEKNANVELKKSEVNKNTLAINIPAPRDGSLTVGRFMFNTIHDKGFNWRYRAKDANCQFFVRNVLRGNGLWNEQVARFTMANDASKIIQNRWLEGVLNGITDVGSVFRK